MDGKLHLATCSYKEFRPHMGLPVRITLGAPRWRLPYELAGNARLLAPTSAIFKLPIDAYWLAYRRLLDTTGVDRITAELTRIAGGADKPLVLLCYERLNEPGEGCHRTLFASWWREKTGQIVPELGAYDHTLSSVPLPAPAALPTPAVEQLTLPDIE